MVLVWSYGRSTDENVKEHRDGHKKPWKDSVFIVYDLGEAGE